jgi:hypothetical protein
MHQIIPRGVITVFLSRNHWTEARSLHPKIKLDSEENLRPRRFSIFAFLELSFLSV